MMDKQVCLHIYELDVIPYLEWKAVVGSLIFIKSINV